MDLAPAKPSTSPEEFGRRLAEAVLKGAVAHKLRDERKATQFGRLLIRLDIQSPELAALPWEFLCDVTSVPQGFLATMRGVSIVRKSPGADEHRLPPVELPLRVKVMVASPRQLATLDLKREVDHLKRTLAKEIERGRVVLDEVAGQTANDLYNAVKPGKDAAHVLHFAGHGDFDERSGEGRLILCDDQGNASALTASRLASKFERSGVRFVLFNCCQSARSSRADLFSAAAGLVAAKGIPAVLAMQYPVADTHAIELAARVYEELAAGATVAGAVGEARVALSNDGFAWGTPVLYLNGPDEPMLVAPEEGAFDLSRLHVPQLDDLSQELSECHLTLQWAAGFPADVTLLLARDPEASDAVAHAFAGEETARERQSLARFHVWQRRELDDLETQKSKPGAHSDAATIDAKIAYLREQGPAKEERHQRAIKDALDRDLRTEFQRILDRAKAALNSEGDPFKGFWMLAGAGRALAMIGRAALRKETVISLDRAFRRSAAELVALGLVEVPSIAAGCLRPIVAIGRVDRRRAELLQELTAEITKLPEARVQERSARAQALCAVALEGVPAFESLEHPDEIAHAERRLEAVCAWTMDHCRSLREEVEAARAELRKPVTSILTRAERVTEHLQTLHAEGGEAFIKVRFLHQLIASARESVALPPPVKALSDGVLREAERRLGAPLASVLHELERSRFGLDEVQTATKPVRTLVLEQQELARRWDDAEALLGRFESALREIPAQPERVARQYAKRLQLGAVAALVPVVGFVAAVSTHFALKRMAPLVATGLDRYQGLGAFAPRWLGGTALIGGGSAVLVTVLVIAGVPAGAVWLGLLVTSSVSLWLGLLVTLSNLRAARALASVSERNHDRGRLTG